MAAAATSCSSESGGGTGGTTSASTTNASAGATTGSGGGTGGTTSASTTSAVSTGASSSTGQACGIVGYSCCAGSCYEVGAACIGDVCVLPVQFGGACKQNDDCESKLCLGSGHCSRPCANAVDCPPAPEWTCAPLANYPADMCQCTASGPEVCDGQDSDCDGVVDDGATCSGAGFTCQNGACACNPANRCNGVCEDIASDPQNCGACGTTCATGAVCSEGHCQTILASGQSLFAIAVDATHLYWTNNDDGPNNSIRKVPLGGGAFTTLASGLIFPRGIALDASHVYWADGDVKNGGTAGTVMKVGLGGGAPITLASAQNLP
ncbi:MAG: hypothetical protein ACMG6S_05935, partial [Byssovorax sp.]